VSRRAISWVWASAIALLRVPILSRTAAIHVPFGPAGSATLLGT
jgi:hypothetical protein